MVKKRILVLSVDRDNDLFAKAKIAGPVIGREANVAAAAKLALADPEETDANTMFEAVKIGDELSKDNVVEIATLTGSEKLGYSADREILKQLERVLAQFKCDSCIFVSDGASDEQVIPIIQSRVKIDSIRVVVMKQAKELEKTYFVLLEKLKEPHYARLVFGIPAILLILLAVGDYMGFGWRLVAIVLGAYLIAKGFGVEEYVLSHLANFRISVEKLGFVFYLLALLLVLIALAQAYEAYLLKAVETTDALKLTAYAVSRLMVLFPWAALIALLGKTLDLLTEKRKYEVVKFGLYGIFVMILWLILSVASMWILADAYFSDFVIVALLSVVFTILAVRIMDWLRMRVALGMKLENKEVLTELGAYIGKTIGVDRKRGVLIVQTAFGQKLDLAFERITGIGDKVVVKY